MKDEKENEKKVNEGKYTITYQKKKKYFQAPGIMPQGASPREKTRMDGTQ